MKRILYIEDDKKLANLVIHYLEHFYLIDHLSSLEDLSLYLAQYPYDLAILDRNIHEVDVGLLAIPKIHDKNREIAIIITSAYGTVDDKIEGLSLGADDYLKKPFDVRELKARIEVLLRKKFPEQIIINQLYNAPFFQDQ